jgi:signal transduction histidine kinase/ligand-binding sensor domain-containing protein
LTIRIIFSFGLVFLAVFGGLPGVGYAYYDATSPVEQSQSPGMDPPISNINIYLQPQISPQPRPSSSVPNIHFDCLSSSDGLSFSSVMSILQDQRGFMWFGTRYGLDKFDGFDFTVYTFESGENVMLGNYIRELFQDRTGDLWFSTYSDLVRRDVETGKFFHYKFVTDYTQSHGPGYVTTIGEDNQGTLWIGTSNGIDRYEPATDTFTHFLAGKGVQSYYVDRQGGIWLGAVSGLRYYPLGQPDQQEPEIYPYDSYDPGSRLSTNLAAAIYEDRQGILWVGSESEGLNRLDRSTGKFTHFQHNPDDQDSISNNNVISILEDSFDRLWIGTYDGLNILDRTTGRFIRYHFNPDDPYSINNNVVNHIYEDRSGVVWVATQGGICKVNETASRFTHYQQGTEIPEREHGVQPGYLSVLSDNHLTAIYQDRHGILWIGTNSGGLNRLDRSTGSVAIYRHDPDDSTSLSPGEVDAIYEDRAGTLWIGTVGGLDRFNPENGTFTAVEAFRGLPVSSILEDSQGSLWVGTWRGIARREPGATGFTPLPSVEGTLVNVIVQLLYIDRNGALWISTQNKGLFRLDPREESGGSTPTLIHFPQDSSDPRSPGISPVMGFYEDSQGALWMGSVNNGLLRFDQDTQIFSSYLPGTGLYKYVGCIQGDAQGFLWVSTALGLATFDPRNGTFSYFDARDGLKTGLGVKCFQNDQGEMLFSSLNGLNTFFPDQIHPNPHPPAVVITALNLYNQPFRSDLFPDEQIRLTYQENYLSFDFAALDYTAPAKNQYAYRMEGIDSAWIEAGTRRHVDYPDLKPGTYTLRVKASNNSGVWNEQGVAVHITITPPFWQTWWFLGLMGLVLVGVIIGGLRLRLRSLEARSRDLEKQVAARTAELRNEVEQRYKVEETLRQHEREKAIIDERNRLARELHDSVTQSLYSVTLFADAATRLLDTGQVPTAVGNLRKLRNTAKNALEEMRLLIFELRPPILEQQGLAAALEARLEAVEGRVGLKTQLRLEGEGQLSPDVQEGLYRIALEALNNVLKHAQANCVTVSLTQAPQVSELKIVDDGVGFDLNTARKSGGLGLKGMKERAEQIGGQLMVTSEPGIGTTVQVEVKGSQ